MSIIKRPKLPFLFLFILFVIILSIRFTSASNTKVVSHTENTSDEENTPDAQKYFDTKVYFDTEKSSDVEECPDPENGYDTEDNSNAEESSDMEDISDTKNHTATNEVSDTNKVSDKEDFLSDETAEETFSPSEQTLLDVGLGTVTLLPTGDYGILMQSPDHQINGKLGNEILRDYLTSIGLDGTIYGSWMNESYYTFFAENLQEIISYEDKEFWD